MQSNDDSLDEESERNLDFWRLKKKYLTHQNITIPDFMRTFKKENDVGVQMNFPANCKNQLLRQDSRDMSIIPSNSVHHMITSPPYNVSKEYDDNLSLQKSVLF